MDLTFSRAAFSPVIAEADDRSHSNPIAPGVARPAGPCRNHGVLHPPPHRPDRGGRDGGARPGDISIGNDPCLGGTHLVDARLAMPL
jgi:N-methylhydantoinase B